MLYLTCTTITSVGLAHYGVSHAKDWVSVDCGTSSFVMSGTLSFTNDARYNIFSEENISTVELQCLEHC